MLKKTEKMYDNAKQSLESLLREKAFNEVKELLAKREINIDSVSDEDIESLVAERVKDMRNGIKGFSMGAAFAITLSLVVGV